MSKKHHKHHHHGPHDDAHKKPVNPATMPPHYMRREDFFPPDKPSESMQGIPEHVVLRRGMYGKITKEEKK